MNDLEYETAAEPINDMISLRRLLWLHHGCNTEHLDAAAGKMLCKACGVFFASSPPAILQTRMFQRMRREVLFKEEMTPSIFPDRPFNPPAPKDATSSVQPTHPGVGGVARSNLKSSQ